MEQKSLVCHVVKVQFKVFYNSLVLVLTKVLSRTALSIVFRVMTYLEKKADQCDFLLFYMKIKQFLKVSIEIISREKTQRMKNTINRLEQHTFSVQNLKQKTSEFYISLKFSYYQLQSKVFEEQVLCTHDICIIPTALLLCHSCLKPENHFKF